MALAYVMLFVRCLLGAWGWNSSFLSDDIEEEAAAAAAATALVG